MLEPVRLGLNAPDLADWVRSFGGNLQEGRVLNDKGWSVVIHLKSVVLKITAAGFFPHGARMFERVGRASPGQVPDLLGWRIGPEGQTQMLFRPFGGIPVASCPIADRASGLTALARSFGKIQANLKHLPSADLPAVPAARIPAMLDEILEGAIRRCQKDHPDFWSAECAKQSVPAALDSTIRTWRGAVADWADELEDGGWSTGVDHVDLLPHNANLLPNGDCIVYDWEQATIGVPFFSLDVLLAYAQSIDEGATGLVLSPERTSPTQKQIHEAFLNEFPGPLDLALRLAPIRYCWAEWNQAEAVGMTRYGVDDVVWWLSRSLKRWEAAAVRNRIAPS